MLFMGKIGRDKIALFLACMSVFVNRTSAMNTNKVRNLQAVFSNALLSLPLTFNIFSVRI